MDCLVWEHPDIHVLYIQILLKILLVAVGQTICSTDILQHFPGRLHFCWYSLIIGKNITGVSVISTLTASSYLYIGCKYAEAKFYSCRAKTGRINTNKSIYVNDIQIYIRNSQLVLCFLVLIAISSWYHYVEHNREKHYFSLAPL